MDTDTLLMLLQTTYPFLDIYPLRYEFEGEEHYCIMLDYTCTSIHDPIASATTSRFNAPPSFYGLSLDHAKLMRRHNLHFEYTQLWESFDLTEFMSRIIEESVSTPDRLAENPREFLLDLGFEERDTGGGVKAYRLDDPFTKDYLLVYDNFGEGIPSTFADIEMARFSIKEDPVGLVLDIKGNDVSKIEA
jgi:hypothetical protein